MTRKKAIFAVIFFCVCMMCMPITCSAKGKIPLPTARNEVFVYDEGNIISEETEAKLNEMLNSLEKQTEIEFAVISVKSLINYDIETYANEVFNELGIGKEDKDNGILLLISKPDSRVRLEIGRGLEGCLNDAKCGRILDNYFVPHREQDDYNKATDLTVQAVITALAESEDYTFEIENLEAGLTVSEGGELKTLDIVLIILIILLVVVTFLGSMSSNSDSDDYYGGSSGSFSGGGFSGGGFSGGGFGGGSSGGGGASR